MDEVEITHTDVWHGVYKGISFEIKNFKRDGLAEYHIKDSDNWTYYIYFLKHQLNPEVFANIIANLKIEKHGNCNYYDSPIANLEWHCGITFGELTLDENKEIRALKAGCDYQHYWDEGYTYCLDYVKHDVLKTIDSFIEIFPDYANKPLAPL